jgi:hypothetical protein
VTYSKAPGWINLRISPLLATTRRKTARQHQAHHKPKLQGFSDFSGRPTKNLLQLHDAGVGADMVDGLRLSGVGRLLDDVDGLFIVLVRHRDVGCREPSRALGGVGLRIGE